MATGCIPQFMVHILSVAKFIVLVKWLGDIQPIVAGELFYCLFSKALCL